MIHRLEEFDLITNKQSMTTLNVIGNPIERDSRCTFEYFRNIFPNLKDFNDKLQSGLNGLSILKPMRIERTKVPVLADLTNSNLFAPNLNEKNQDMNQIPTKRLKQQNRIRPNVTYDLLQDFDKYVDESIFENQKTATFAQIHRHHPTNDSILLNQEDEPPQLTDRILNFHNHQSNFPFPSDQSMIRGNLKSIDASLVRYSPTRNSTNASRQNFYTQKNQNPQGHLNATTIEANSLEESIISSNLFEKHISNIDLDIQNLAVVFHQKNLKEKALKSLKMAGLHYREQNQKAERFYQNWKQIQILFAWKFFVNAQRKKSALIRTINSSKSQEENEQPFVVPNKPEKRPSLFQFTGGKIRNQFRIQD